MKRVILPILAAALSFGCSNIKNAANDAVTIELGADSLSPIQFDQSVTLGPAKLPACLDASAALPSSETTVALMRTDGGCMLTVTQPNLVLADAQTIARARKAKGSFDVDGVRSGSIELQKLDLSLGDGSALKLSDYIDAVSVEIDGEALLDQTATAELEGNAKLTRELPAPIIAKLKRALTNNQVATADVVLTLWLGGQALTNPPDSLKMLLVLQPTLKVNVVDAAF
jgi:hypothetical protein